MNAVDAFFSKSNVIKYFDKKILRDKSIRDTLVSFEEVLSIKKKY